MNKTKGKSSSASHVWKCTWYLKILKFFRFWDEENSILRVAPNSKSIANDINGINFNNFLRNEFRAIAPNILSLFE